MLAQMARYITTIAVTAAAGALLVPSTAAAASRCAPPSTLTWHSCLSAAHRPINNTKMVRLTRVKVVLVERMSSCPSTLEKRRVTIRTGGHKRIARQWIEGTCRNNVARWRLKLKPNVDLRSGTRIFSLWTGVDDADTAPSVQLGERNPK